MAAAAVMLLSGCGGGAGGLLGGGTTTSCSPKNYTITFPATVGFSAVGDIAAAVGCFSSATVDSTSSTGPAIGSAFSSPGATTLLYLGVTFTASEYATGTPTLTVTLPSTLSTAGKQFYLAYNNSGTGSVFGWTAAIAGPVSASGNTVTFTGGSSATTFTANQEYEFAVYDK